MLDSPEMMTLFRQSLLCTMYVAGIVSLITSILGCFLGILLTKCRFIGRSSIGLCLILGIITPLHLQTATWLLLFGRNGAMTSWLFYFYPNFSIYQPGGLILIHTIAYLPMAIYIWIIALATTQSELEHQTALYLSPWQRMIWVILPQVRHCFFLSFSWVFILSAGDMTASDVLGIDTLARQIYLCISLYYRLDYALAMSLPLLLVIIFGIAAFYLFLKHSNLALLGFYQRTPTYLFQNHWLSLTGLCCLPYLIQLPVLIYGIGNWSQFVMAYQSTQPELLQTIYLACLAATLLLAVSWIIHWIQQRWISPWLLGTALAILWITPSSVLGILILRFFQTLCDVPLLKPIALFLRDSNIPLLLGWILRYLPYGVLLLCLALQTIPPQFMDWMRILGCGKIGQTIQAGLYIKKYAVALWLFLLACCMGESEITLLLIPPGITTLTIRMFTLMHYGVRADVCSCGIFLLLLMVIAIILARIILGKKNFEVDKK